MNTTMMKFAFAAAVMATASGVLAQEADSDPIAAAAAAAARAVNAAAGTLTEKQIADVNAKESAKIPAPSMDEMSKDVGVQAVIKMQENRKKITQKELSKVEKGKDDASTAEAKVRYILKKNGIDEGRTSNAFVKIVDAEMFMEKDPSDDEEFYTDRDLLAKQLILMMKGAIVESIGNSLKAHEQFEIFGKTNAVMKTSYGAVASAPLFGVTGLAQAESYDKQAKSYHMSLAAVWSKKLHECAKATLMGKTQNSTASKDKKTVVEWIDGLEADGSLAMVCGPRQIVDPNGNRVFLGISSALVGVDSLADQASKEMAKSSAFATLAFSLTADVEQAVADKRRQVTRRDSTDKGKLSRKTNADFYKSISQSIGTEENPFVVKGASEVCSRIVEHPMTHQKIYVSVYAVDADAVAKSGVIAKELIATKIITELENNRNLAEIAEGKAMIQEARDDKASFAEGAARLRDGVNDKIRQNKNYSPVKKTERGMKRGSSTEGVFSGEQKIEADF